MGVGPGVGAGVAVAEMGVGPGVGAGVVAGVAVAEMGVGPGVGAGVVASGLAVTASVLVPAGVAEGEAVTKTNTLAATTLPAKSLGDCRPDLAIALAAIEWLPGAASGTRNLTESVPRLDVRAVGIPAGSPSHSSCTEICAGSPVAERWTLVPGGAVDGSRVNGAMPLAVLPTARAASPTNMTPVAIQSVNVRWRTTLGGASSDTQRYPSQKVNDYTLEQPDSVMHRVSVVRRAVPSRTIVRDRWLQREAGTSCWGWVWEGLPQFRAVLIGYRFAGAADPPPPN